MADTEWVDITHPDVDGTGRVAASALNHWRARGWVVAPPPPPRAPAPTKAATPKTNPADDMTATEKKAEG